MVVYRDGPTIPKLVSLLHAVLKLCVGACIKRLVPRDIRSFKRHYCFTKHLIGLTAFDSLSLNYGKPLWHIILLGLEERSIGVMGKRRWKVWGYFDFSPPNKVSTDYFWCTTFLCVIDYVNSLCQYIIIWVVCTIILRFSVCCARKSQQQQHLLHFEISCAKHDENHAHQTHSNRLIAVSLVCNAVYSDGNYSLIIKYFYYPHI